MSNRRETLQAVAKQVIRLALVRQFRVGIFIPEQEYLLFSQLALAEMAKVDPTKIDTANLDAAEFNRIMESARDLSQLPIKIHKSEQVEPDEFQQMLTTHKPEIIFCCPPIGDWSGMVQLAKENEVSVVYVSA